MGHVYPVRDSLTTAQAARAARNALGALSAHAALDDEFKRIGAPGSAWNDDERATWEAELADTTVDAYERELGTPEQITARAIQSLQPDESRGEFDAELEKLSTPPPHEQRLRDLAVEDWEAREGRHLRGD